uniref:Ovule protein n=1 Tax=Heterorhabditis bacteriophora TaxID=37862 RepID=A0A1I7X228_HETBA
MVKMEKRKEQIAMSRYHEVSLSKEHLHDRQFCYLVISTKLVSEIPVLSLQQAITLEFLYITVYNIHHYVGEVTDYIYSSMTYKM